MMLIKGWQTWWRWWSTWLKLAGATIITFSDVLPHMAINTWSYIPDDIKQSFPQEWVSAFGVTLIVASFFAQLVRQRKAHLIAESDSGNAVK